MDGRGLLNHYPASVGSQPLRFHDESLAESWRMGLLHEVGSLVRPAVRCIGRPGRMATSLQPSQCDQPFRVRGGFETLRRIGSFPRPFAMHTGDAHRTQRRPEPRRHLGSSTCLRAVGSVNARPQSDCGSKPGVGSVEVSTGRPVRRCPDLPRPTASQKRNLKDRSGTISHVDEFFPVRCAREKAAPASVAEHRYGDRRHGHSPSPDRAGHRC